jgi:hypothetical protein
MRKPRNTKPSNPGLNPKDRFGIRKVPLMSVLPIRVLAGIALGMKEGAAKYGAYNYRAVGVLTSVYVDAASRHLAQFWEGEDFDTESKAGLHHIDKAICSLVALRDGILQGNCVDDRPPPADPDWMNRANATAGDLVDVFPDPAAPITAKVLK